MLSDWGASDASAFQWGIVAAASLVAALFDLRFRRIPNLLTGSLVLSGILFSTIRSGPSGLANSLGGCVVLAVPFIALWLFAGGGAADAKLMGAVGAWLGFSSGTFALVCVLGCGVVMGVVWTALSKRRREVMWNVLLLWNGFAAVATGRQSMQQVSATLPDPQRMLKMPYGLAICMGVIIAALGARLWHN